MTLECVPISMYCNNTGETIDAINKRVQRGVWREGVQILKIDGVKERWIDLTEVNKWARRDRRPLPGVNSEPDWAALDELEQPGRKKKPSS